MISPVVDVANVTQAKPVTLQIKSYFEIKKT